ncbi:hypothetical protein ISG33_02430 [Glaciecola sp. MH2013]|uniref:hypothetical protein n=1 Tax=Glaciecola sp. MH2013 TaxID=2785524 RepID=UPI00189CA5AC|nr:hypothetical protein [Glaciecola sp. MH2013]MBF7072258.1 hypothetical protein [Glaciecola sp. MH2013]
MTPEMQQALNICIALNRDNKKPSVGMIKAKSPSPLPIPVIIKSLSYWKENKDRLVKEGVQVSNKAVVTASQSMTFSKEQASYIDALVNERVNKALVDFAAKQEARAAESEGRVNQLEMSLASTQAELKALQQQLEALASR